MKALMRDLKHCYNFLEEQDLLPTSTGNNSLKEIAIFIIKIHYFSSKMMPPDLVSGTPGDTLQYLSQLEMVARKLKHQIIKQKQVNYQPF